MQIDKREFDLSRNRPRIVVSTNDPIQAEETGKAGSN
jgi:hypothetical protein